MPSLYKKALLSLIFLLSVIESRAQHYYFKHYQVDNGLAHNTVTKIIQDKKGLMWIGTKGGLNSFDGYTFKSYKDTHNKFGTIGNNIITTIGEDLHGMIWIGTERGIFKYDPYKDAVRELVLRPLSYINEILVDKKNNLWFLADGRLCTYNQEKKKITVFNIYGNSLASGMDGKFWIGTYNAVKNFDPGNGKIKNTVFPGTGVISKIYAAERSRILIGTTKSGLKSYNPLTNKVEPLLARNEDNTTIFVRDIMASARDEYWIATESGLYIYNTKTRTYLQMKKRPGDQYSISDNAVYSICKDNRGGIWAGTFFGGLNYFTPGNSWFRKYYPLHGYNSIAGNAVREIYSNDPRTIWIGTEDAGISKFDTRTETFTNYTSDGRSGSISYPNVHGLLAVKDRLYIGLFQKGLEIMDIKSGRIIERHSMIRDKDKFASDFVVSIYQTADSTLLIGTGGAGLFIFDPVKRKLKKQRAIPPDSFVYVITEDHEGTLWIGTLSRGTFYYNPKTGRKGNIRFNKENGDGPANEYVVQGIYEDSNHFLWFTTEGGGLIKMSPDRKTIKKFTTNDGLPTNNLFRILEDAGHNLWISSLKGLICLNPETEKLKVYTQSNGLITDQFNYNSAFRDHKGNMYFGSVAGMVTFSPSEFKKPESSPPLYITEFQINNKKAVPDINGSPLKKSISYTDSLVLNYDQSTFNVEFAALNYSSSQVVRYKYIMKGLDTDWTYLDRNRNAYFTGLAPGDYTFVVVAESNTGSWISMPRSLYIKILPPFWKSYPAFAMYFLAVVLAVYFAVRNYRLYLEKKNQNKLRLFEHEKEKEIYQAKIEFFTNIAHEIQTPLTLIKGPVEVALGKLDNTPAVKKNLELVTKSTNRLIALTTQLLDFRKTEINQFGLNFVSANINHLLNDIIRGFEPEIMKHEIDFKAEVPDVHIKAFVDKEAFTKITVNLLSNAIKYSEKSIFLKLYLPDNDSETFKIRIINDGDPIPPQNYNRVFEPFYRLDKHKSLHGTGIGLPLAKSLAELHNGTLCIVDNHDKLNIFELTLPLRQKVEFKLREWKNLNKNEGES